MGNGLGLAALIGAGAGLTILVVRPQTFDAVTDFANGGHFAAEDRNSLVHRGVKPDEISDMLDGHEDLRDYAHWRNPSKGTEVHTLGSPYNSQGITCYPLAIEFAGTKYKIFPKGYCPEYLVPEK